MSKVAGKCGMIMLTICVSVYDDFTIRIVDMKFL